MIQNGVIGVVQHTAIILGRRIAIENRFTQEQRKTGRSGSVVDDIRRL